MRFKIPFTFSKTEVLKKKSKFFISKIKHKKNSNLTKTLKQCDINLSREQYLGIIRRNVLITFISLQIFSLILLGLMRIGNFVLYSILLTIIFSIFIFFSQIIYPVIYVSRRQKNIEKNIIPGLEDMLIQVNSGIPLFSILVNISSADYGILSEEFRKAVKKINAGEPDVKVLKDIGKDNPSVFFRRTLWQISNGMVAGSDMGIVIRDTIKSLNEEQLIQIQNYGSKLNPLIVMYMLITVIIPTLSITFLTILSSMIQMEKTMAMLMYVTLFVFVIFAQIMFLGLIKSRRPSLL